MSLSVKMFIEEKKEDGKWVNVAPLVPSYDGKELVPAEFEFGNGYHELFERMGLEEGYENYKYVDYNLPKDASEEVKKEYKEWTEYDWVRVVNINLADLHVALLETPKVEDWDDENSMIDNPIKHLYNKAWNWITVWHSHSYIEAIESNYRIIAWVA